MTIMNHNENTKKYIPYLPQIPDKIYNQKNFEQCLTTRTDNEWRFLFREIENIPLPFSENQDYNFDKIMDEDWKNVIAPSSLIMQGFDIENNTEYYYKRTIKMPKVRKTDKIILRFEGVYSNARIWVNNQYLKTHIGGFTQWDCDISRFADKEEITLVVGVTDVEGNKKGIWNPDGETISNAAWASYYAHCNIGGIIRDITLFVLPESYIARTHINTQLIGKNAIIEVYMEAFSNTDDVSAEIVFEDESKGIVSKSVCHLDKLLSVKTENNFDVTPDRKWARKNKKSCQNDEKYKSLFVPSPCDFKANYSAGISLKLDNPKLWDSEHPNLYTLKIRLFANGIIQQENIHKVGIREITFGGKNGTDKNKVYVNGREIKLHGVCRHDVSHLYGRSLTKEDIYNEILSYKKNNINFIRTSHYPASDYMLEVCDELGMYVEQENAACFKGANNFEIYNGPQEFLQSFAEMIESARNHASVMIWSLANESDFEKTYAFREEYNYVKEIDSTRPAIFSYPHLVRSKPLPYDIISKHYAKVTGNLGDKKLPLLHDEFAHVSCYNLDRLREDNSVRDFWGESIKIGWDSIFKTDGALGCAIWAAIDDVFCIPKVTSKRHQSHSDGQYAGYGEWGCMLDMFKREKPEAYLTKKAFTPILIDENKIVFDDELQIYVTNRFDHTNLSEVKMVISDDAQVIFDDYIPSSIEPHKSGAITIKHNGADKVKAEFYLNENLIDTYSFCRCQSQIEIQKGTSSIEDCLELKDTTFICKKAKYKIIKKKMSDRINIKVIPANLPALFAKPNHFVLRLKLKSDVKSVSWERKAQYSVYPEGHISRADGTAYPLGTDNEYGKKPEKQWQEDNENYFLYSEACGKRKLSNDFMTRRNNIKRYTVAFSNGKNLHVIGDGSINAYVCKSDKEKDRFELQITAGCYYPDLLWGNYLGKRFWKIKDKIISFSLSCEN